MLYSHSSMTLVFVRVLQSPRLNETVTINRNEGLNCLRKLKIVNEFAKCNTMRRMLLM